MSCQTILLDFTIEPTRIGDSESRKSLLKKIRDILEGEFFGQPLLDRFVDEEEGLAVLSSAVKNGTIVTIRFFEKDGLITLNIEYFLTEGQTNPFNLDSLRVLEKSLIKQLSLLRGHSIPPIHRSPITKYFPTSDERIIEYDIDEVLFEEQSPFQKVQIVHSKSLGNMLVLDELQNLAEADLIYTETLMMRGVENYEGKDVCILGGGDGALLYELLKENPKHVVMLEIDEMVMEGCNKYMRSVCGDVLEKRKGDNFEIIIGDCMAILDKYIKEGKQFDYVFGDLTDIPLSETPTGEIWNFIRTILEASFKVLKPDGKYMTHGNGSSCPESLRMYEEQLKKLDPPVSFTMSKAFVPSFMEEWNFYQVSRV